MAAYLNTLLTQRATDYEETKLEIAGFLKTYGQLLVDTVMYLQEWRIIDKEATHYKLEVAEELAALHAALIMARDEGKVSELNAAIIDHGPKTLEKARDILGAWYPPYFKAARLGGNRKELQIPEEGGYDWRPVPGQKDSAVEWSNFRDPLHEASEVFRGRIKGEKVVPSLPGSV